MKKDLVQTKYSLFTKRIGEQVLAPLLVHLIIMRDKKSLVSMGMRHLFLNKYYTCLANNMEQLQKTHALAKDQGLTTNLSFKMSVALVNASTFVLAVHVPCVVAAPTVVADTTQGITPEVEQLTTATIGVYIHKPSSSSSPAKRTWGDIDSY